MSNVRSRPVPTSGYPLTSICLERYDRSPKLTCAEQDVLQRLVQAFDAGKFNWPEDSERPLQRLLRPLGDVLEFIQIHRRSRVSAVRVMIREMHATHLPYWSWDDGQWTRLFQVASQCARLTVARPSLRAFAYILGELRHLPETDECKRYHFAGLVLGQQPVREAVAQVLNELTSWGYDSTTLTSHVQEVLSEFFLVNGSAKLEALPADIVERAQLANPSVHFYNTARTISRALVSLGCIQHPLIVPDDNSRVGGQPATNGISPEWVGWCQKWAKTSTLAPGSVISHYYALLKAGRWMTTTHPAITSPAQWTRELAVEYVAAVNHMVVGDYVSSQDHLPNLGKPLSARAKKRLIVSVSTFFQDCQEWDWIPKTFNPERCFWASRSLNAQLKPNPRVIDDAMWAKLIWAGLNLKGEDLAANTHYPLELVRAMAAVWLFSGLRLNEICRLRVGCIRWDSGATRPNEASSLADTVCLLDVPVNKTSGAFTKPIARLAGQAIAEWEAVRPSQPLMLDPKTGENVHYLFAYRGKRIGNDFINVSIIPLLCRKAGIPQQDQRGKLSSHRARATIATQLANAKDPMSLLELQQWLGHSSPLSTQYYVMVSPTRLSHAYADAGYLDRNIRAIEVLIDQDAIRSGATAAGQPWKYYDLGHGHCTYDFFDQCPHRMACAKCSFYVPKESAQAQLLQAKTNLLRMKQEIPLMDDELAALEEDLAAVERLCQRLADVPTPAGLTPRQIQTNAETIIPLSQVR